MNFITFLKYVKIQTKLASTLPFIFGSLFSIYYFKSFKLDVFLIMFSSLLIFDMTTTAINSYIDYIKAKDENYKQNENIIGIDNINLTLARNVIFIMFFISSALGILLVIKTNIIVLFIGMFSFFVGIFYTYGPIPISRLPLGEIISGFVMGFIIVFLAIYIHNPNLIELGYTNQVLSLDIKILDILAIGIVSMPFVLSISNLMLANNIYDLEVDIKNDRFLLPYFIGRDNALTLYKYTYYSIFVIIGFSMIIEVLPYMFILTFICLPKVIKNTSKIYTVHPSDDSVAMSITVQNLLMISTCYIIPLLLCIIVY